MPFHNNEANQSISDKYEFEDSICSGSYGTVYKGVDKHSGALVAIKEIPHEKVKENELKVINHIMALESVKDRSYLLKIEAIYEDEDHLYMVMEFLQGELFDYIANKGRLSLDEARMIFQQLICGVHVLHRENIAHRDLKPENILIRKDPDLDTLSSIVISDYGFSKCFSDDVLLRTSCGSPHYVAPEVLSGDPYTNQVDIWSCGVILYAMLYGCLPFDHANTPTLLNMINKGKFDITDSIPPEVNTLLCQMICVDPQKRISISQIVAHPWFQIGLAEDIKNAFLPSADIEAPAIDSTPVMGECSSSSPKPVASLDAAELQGTASVSSSSAQPNTAFSNVLASLRALSIFTREDKNHGVSTSAIQLRL